MSDGSKDLPALYFFGGPRDRGHKNFFCSSPQQYSRTLACGCAGSHDVINQQNALPADCVRPKYHESSPDVGATLMPRKTGLGGSLPLPSQRSGIQLDACRSFAANQRPRNLLRLIKAARAAFARPKGNGKYQEIRRQIGAGNHAANQFPQQTGRRLYLVVLQKMDKITQRSGIGPIRKCLAKWRRGPAAKPT